MATAIHVASKRHGGPFVAVDCSMLAEGLIESELFGHAKGAFTGATASHIGHFERANGGTLFLDEIGTLPLSIQAKLLRVLQERTLERVGGSGAVKLDIRVLSATNVNLLDAVGAGTFRTDLYYRLADVTITPPPLREPETDVTRLAAYFVQRYAQRFAVRVRGLSPETLALLAAYDWPGNVRELESAMKSAVILAKDVVQLGDLPARIADRVRELGGALHVTPAGGGDRIQMNMEIELGDDLDSFNLKALANAATEKAERAVLEALVRKGRHSRVQLARMLNLDPKTLRTRLRKYGIETPSSCARASARRNQARGGGEPSRSCRSSSGGSITTSPRSLRATFNVPGKASSTQR